VEIQVNLGDRKRKELAKAIGEITGEPSVYKGAPGYAYEVDGITVDRNAVVILAEGTALADIRLLVDALREQGFQLDWPEEIETLVESEPAAHENVADGRLVIQLPLEGFTETALENLRLIVASKALLIKKALDLDDLSIEKNETTVDFPWFDRELLPEEVAAYTHFIALLADMAKRQTRVLATAKPVENEKYQFRCFLLRLGMIGEEYAVSRKILLRNLSGNGSMKSGERRVKKEPGEISAASSPEQTTEPVPIRHRFSLKKLLGWSAPRKLYQLKS